MALLDRLSAAGALIDLTKAFDGFRWPDVAARSMEFAFPAVCSFFALLMAARPRCLRLHTGQLHEGLIPSWGSWQETGTLCR